MICLSLKYVNMNQKTISGTSKWIHSNLGKCQYVEGKLTIALEEENLEKVKFLIRFNKNSQLLSKWLREYCLVRRKCYDIIKLLIDNGADIRIDNDCVIQWASETGHFDIVKLSIDEEANVCVNSNQALKKACINGHYDIAKLLIKNGANVHADNNIPMRLASEFGHFDIVELLVENRNDQKNELNKIDF